MNSFATWIATLSFAVVAAPAVADEVRFVHNEIGYEMVLTPSKVTRAQVVADLQQAQRNAEIPSSYEVPQPLHLVPSEKSREQVRREAANVSERERAAQHSIYRPNA